MIYMELVTRLDNLKTGIVQVIDDLPIGLATASIYGFIQPFVQAEADFLIWLSILLVSDMVIGMWKHFRKKTFSTDGVGRFFDKVIVSIGVVIIVNFAKDWGAGEGYFGGFFEDSAEFTLLWWIGLSIADNIYVISGEKYPPKAWIEQLRSITFSRMVGSKNTGSGNNPDTDSE